MENSNLINKIGLYTDPNLSHGILFITLKEVIESYMPSKVIKFNKHKHKGNKWITNGIKSIHFRDELYMKIKKTKPDSPKYEQLYINLRTQLIRNAKISYHHSNFLNFQLT